MRKLRLRIGIIRCPAIVWLLNKIYNVIPKLPYSPVGWRVMAWILRHTPADDNETY